MTVDYVLDTSAIIDWLDWYPPDVFPKFWEHINQQVGQLWVLPEKVFQECINGAAKDWVAGIDTDLDWRWTPDAEALMSIYEIENQFPALAPRPNRPNRADSHVVACAQKINAAVVSSDIKLVNAARSLNLRHAFAKEVGPQIHRDLP